MIYWFGYVETAVQLLKDEDIGVVLSDTFPEHWMFPTGHLASENHTPPFMNTTTDNGNV